LKARLTVLSFLALSEARRGPLPVHGFTMVMISRWSPDPNDDMFGN